MMADEHRTEMVLHVLTGDWQAICSCGWSGEREHTSAVLAAADSQEHIRAIAYASETTDEDAA